MKTKTIVFGFVAVLIICLFWSNASASYIGTTSGNDNNNNPTNVLGVITSDPDYNPNDYTWETDPLDFFTKIQSPGSAEIEQVFKYKTDGYSYQITVTEIKTNNPNQTTGEIIGGTWSSTKPVDFVAIKAGNGFAVFSVDQTTDGVWSGDWSIAESELGVGNGNIPGLSHISFYSGGGNTPPGGGAQVPEPATIFLLGSGLLGFFGFRKKFWKSKK